ncbi:MAG: inositol monophosphatase [Clostridia bacterium]|nr:inositol monophosphatase [Clostridia bacterium]MCD8295031.1 inositol monophosphatase [Clostridia bacterium]
MKYAKELEFLTTELKAAYEKVKGLSMHVKQKSTYDLVTDLDYGMEKILTARIREQFPEDRLIAEEFSAVPLTDSRTWSVDPIDGTVNMANGIPIFGVQASLLIKKKPVAACVYHPLSGDLIYAVTGEGTYVNGRRTHVNEGKSICNAVLSFADYPHTDSRLAEGEKYAVEHVYQKVAKIRLFGCACYDFSYVAMGKTDGTVIISKNVWDLAPGWLICEEAGAYCCELDGSPFSFDTYKGLIACSTEELKDLMVRGFTEGFSKI